MTEHKMFIFQFCNILTYFRTTLARWRAAQVSDTGKERERRPYLASECHDLPKAEKWRMQIIREIAKKVAQIQNGMLFVVPYVMFLKQYI